MTGTSTWVWNEEEFDGNDCEEDDVQLRVSDFVLCSSVDVNYRLSFHRLGTKTAVVYLLGESPNIAEHL